ncbi:MAG: heme A synthase [Alphaproteobacteria bacterium]|nr:heme A synthase [Alphaproteobacteria bacterium]
MPAANRALIVWLLFCCALVAGVTSVGAVTRLTESGLSITQWKPVTGALPPLSAAAWETEFAAYRETPQYRLLNAGMELPAFKRIYFWEWSHRLLARLAGLTFALPFFFFLARGMVPRQLRPRLWLILGLGALQGGIGWLMVQSGLTGNMVSVSHLRLALHLSMALIVFALLLWTALDILRAGAAKNPAITFCLRRHGWSGLVFLALAIIYGALVAGLDAGLAYNTFPLMNGHILPPEAWTLQPWWKNFLDNTALVQFTHRTLAIIAALLAFTWGLRLRALGARGAAGWLLAFALFQPALGIATVLFAAPLALAAMHQMGALVLLAVMLVNLHMVETAKTEAACLKRKTKKIR